MNRKMNLVLLVVFASMMTVMGFTSCGKKASATKISGEAFNLDLPLTYNVPTEAVGMLDLPQLSAKSLFDEASFRTDEGFTVVCESKVAKSGTFTGVLLLSIGGKEALRWTISLRSDSDGEFLYITEISLKNLESGVVASESYDGTQGSAANLAGMFVGLLKYFYDKDKLFASRGISAAATPTESTEKGSKAVTPNSEADFDVALTEDGEGAVITDYTGKAAAVIIPAAIQGMPVREIGKEAFQYKKNITSVVIPEGVIVIRESAFNTDEKLVQVTLY